MTYTPPDAAAAGLPVPDGGAASAVLRIGEWQFDADAGELQRGAESVRLEPKATEVMLALARQPGQAVSRDELLSSVWPGVVVGDDALTQTILKLRKALGDDARRPRYIETLSKRGYRLIATVDLGPAGPGSEAPPPPVAAGRRPGWRTVAWTAGVAVLLASAAGVTIDRWGGGAGLGWPLGADGQAPGRAAAPPIVVVLPLVNLSGNPQRDYFSDGVTADLIGALGRYSGLRVISHNSVQQLRPPANGGPAHVPGALGARYIVRGSVRESGDQLRVAVELSDVRNGQVLWAQHFDRGGQDIFAIQDQIVQHIVGTLAVRVTHLEQQRAASAAHGSLQAYDLVLRARTLVVQFDRAANRQARELLAQAQSLSPDYAEIDVVWAAAEYNRANFGWVEDPAESLRRAEMHARRALTLNDAGAHARAHGQLGLIHSMRGEFERALVEAGRAIEINPSDAVAFDAQGTTLVWLGRFDEAIESLETAFRFDPAGRSSGSGFSLSLAHHALGQGTQALAAADATLARYPDASFVLAMRAAALSQMGKPDAARGAADQLRRIAPFFSVDDFGARFVDPAHKIRLQQDLRAAGL